jgi:hypothetical protein
MMLLMMLLALVPAFAGDHADDHGPEFDVTVDAVMGVAIRVVDDDHRALGVDLDSLISKAGDRKAQHDRQRDKEPHDDTHPFTDRNCPDRRATVSHRNRPSPA